MVKKDISDSSINDNPIIDDLEDNTLETVEGINNISPMKDLTSAIETILSEDHFDQKTIISNENEIGLIGIDVVQAHMLKSFKYEFPSLKALKESKQEHAVSVGGKRSEQIVDIFKSLQTQIVTGEPSLTKRLLGK